MEDFEMTPMTTGTAVSISQTPVERTVDVPSSEDTITSSEVFSDPNLGVDTPKDEAEMLFKSAKEEGFEEALTHLAKGDFDKTTSEEQPDKDVLTDEAEIAEPVTENEITEEITEPEEAEILEKIEILEEKVSHLIEQNEHLQEKLVKSDESAQMSQEMLIAMFKYLYEIAKKEEDEKTKLSLFEALLAFVAKFMITVVDPDAKIENGKKEEKSDSSIKKPESFEEMMKFLKEKRTKSFG